MILGRPTNTWTGLLTLFSGAIATTAVTMGADPVMVGQLIGPWTLVLGGVITFVANQPPTVNQGDDVHVITPPDQDNVTIKAGA